MLTPFIALVRSNLVGINSSCALLAPTTARPPLETAATSSLVCQLQHRDSSTRGWKAWHKKQPLAPVEETRQQLVNNCLFHPTLEHGDSVWNLLMILKAAAVSNRG
jgi:hypothetical protein